MFAAELASAGEKAVTAATLDAAACSSGFAEMMQALAALVG
jgi:hypothetical protein